MTFRLCANVVPLRCFRGRGGHTTTYRRTTN